MRRAVIIGNNPYRTDYQFRDFRTLFEEVGSNTGNQAITFGLASQMAQSAAFLPWGAPADVIRRAGDILVFPLANFLGSHTDLGRLADRIEEIGMPVLGMGLGAQSRSIDEDITLTPGTRRWIEVITSLSPGGFPNLGLRGSYTAEQLLKLGFPNAGLTTGCPSSFINSMTDYVESVAAGFGVRPRKIAVTAGIPFIPALQSIERELADIVTLTDGAYIVQHGINMVQLARNDFTGMKEGALEQCRAYINPDLSTDEFVAWCRRYAYAFFDVPAWIDYLRGFDFVVGTRFHGVMLALQAGVAAGCITHDSRTAEMCKTMGVPYIHFDQINHPITRYNVLDLFSFDAEAFRATRRQLHANFLKIYNSAELDLSQAFVNFRL